MPGDEENCRKRVGQFCDDFAATPEGRMVTEVVETQKNQPQSVAAMEAAAKRKSPYKASWLQQFWAVLKRSWLSVVKEPLVMQVRFAQTIVSSAREYMYVGIYLRNQVEVEL